MKPQRLDPRRLFLYATILTLTVRLFANARAAGPEVVRVAVTPFYAPNGNANLEQGAALLPELVTVELSHQNRFQLVERDKVSVIWNELHLSGAGLISADTVSKFGQVLRCDWLITGSLVTGEEHTQVWVKLIDMANAAVLDLEAMPYEATNVSATASAIAAFVIKPHSRTQGRQFVAVGQFTDMSISSAHADWSRRLPALIERYCHASGLGVTERESVKPIFEESQLAASGMTGASTNRVKLLPAFCIVDGGYKWVRDTEDKVSVALRIQKMGEKEQVIRFTKSPGAELESAVTQAIHLALAQTNQLAIADPAIAEGALHSSRGMDLATRNVAVTPPRYSPDSADDQRRKLEESSRSSRAATLAGFERALLLNPNDLQAKTMLGYGLLGDSDPSQRERGKDLLRQVVASNDPSFVERAKRHLANASLYAPRAVGSPNPVSPTFTASAPVAFQNGAPAQQASTKAASSNSVPLLPKPYFVGGFPEMSALRMSSGLLALASGTNLYQVNEIGRVVPLKLPFSLEHPVRSISIDENHFWLGTDGGGLLMADKTGSKPPRVFTEKDGLLMPSIRCSALFDDRLWLGFGYRNAGGLGYLDVKTSKFVGINGDIGLFKHSGEHLHDPPDSAVTMFDVYDKKILWVGTTRGLYQFEIASQKWNLALAAAPNCLTVASNYVAVGMSTGGVMVCSLPDGKWRKIDLFPNIVENGVFALRKDDVNPRLIWVGGDGKIFLLDRISARIVATCPLVGVRNVRWFGVNDQSVWFVGDNAVSGISLVYVFDRTAFPDLSNSSQQVSR